MHDEGDFKCADGDVSGVSFNQHEVSSIATLSYYLECLRSSAREPKNIKSKTIQYLDELINECSGVGGVEELFKYLKVVKNNIENDFYGVSALNEK